MPYATADPRTAPRPGFPTQTLRRQALPVARLPGAEPPSRAVSRLARFSEQPDGVAAVLTVAAILADLPAHSAVDMGSWLDDLGHGLDATFGRPGGPSISCGTTPCNVPMSQAITLGLITDLLVSDAYVHGFSPGDGGRIAVSMTGLESFFELTIDDSGRVDQGAMQSRAEGSALASRLTRQLGGWFETPAVIGGRRYVITVPRHTIRLSN